MPLARVITRSPDDASAIHEYLVEHGYRVEFADPSALNLEPADLEINLERLPLDEGLRLASEWAESAGADVYVASGAVPMLVEPEPARESAGPPEISSYVPLAFHQAEEQQAAEAPVPKSEVVRETIVQAAGIVADSLHETKDAVSQSFNDMKQRFVRAREERAPEPSRLERWNRALAERRAARQERKAREREMVRLQRQQRAEREARAAAMARDLREQRAREMASKPTMVASVATPQPARPSLQAAAERRVSAPRRDSHRHDEGSEYWRGAFSGAAVVAVILMVAWVTLGTTHPPASGTTSGHVKQDVPFGPVTLTPSAAPARPATPVPQSDSAQLPAARAVTPAPKPAPVRSHRAHRAAGNAGVADDEVIVHHYGATKPSPASNTTAQNGGPKRISDQ